LLCLPNRLLLLLPLLRQQSWRAEHTAKSHCLYVSKCVACAQQAAAAATAAAIAAAAAAELARAADGGILVDDNMQSVSVPGARRSTAKGQQLGANCGASRRFCCCACALFYYCYQLEI
jgi:hypothetical protein